MMSQVATFLARSLGLLVVIGFISVGVALYQDTRNSDQFTAELERLSSRGPEVLFRGSDAGAASKQVRNADVQQIQAIYDTKNEAWCRGDGEAYASLFTDDADFIAFDGTHTSGRAAIAASHQELFDRFMQNTCLQGAIERIRFVNSDAAIAYVRSGTRFDDRSVVRRPSIQTYVAVRQGDGWLFASFHNGRIDPVQDRNILRLAWLGAKTWLFRR